MPYRYITKPRASRKIWSFYRNVAEKYRHTYAEDDMVNNIRSTIHSISLIEKTLPRRKPSLQRWKEYYMTKADKWYFAYTIEGDTIVVHDACHAQNMHEEQE